MKWFAIIGWTALSSICALLWMAATATNQERWMKPAAGWLSFFAGVMAVVSAIWE